MNDKNLKDKPIYLLATLVDINKSDEKYIDESLKVQVIAKLEKYISSNAFRINLKSQKLC